MSRLGMGTRVLALAIASTAWAQVTQRVSVSPTGAQANDGSFQPSISADGRYVVFVSLASNLVPDDLGSSMDVLLRDRELGTTERLTVDPQGGAPDDYSRGPSISADGRHVVFLSRATDLVPGDTNGTGDVFVRDLDTDSTERVSVGENGDQADDNSDSYGFPAISGDGRYVAFVSLAGNLVRDDTNGMWDVFVRDRQAGTTERVSVDSSELQANGHSSQSAPLAMSSDGRYVAFYSHASNLVPDDTNGASDIFVRDRQDGTIERVSVASDGTEGNANCFWQSISADGRFVSFGSAANNLVPGDTNSTFDVFLRDRIGGTTERMSVSSNEVQANDQSTDSDVSSDGRYVVFSTLATNLVPEDTFSFNVVLRDRLAGTTELISVNVGGPQLLAASGSPVFSGDARLVAFYSQASLVPGDTNHVDDIFVRDRLGGTAFASTCDAGRDGVKPCPCSNPPGGEDRGCDNSAATGGAVVSAHGGTFLSSDSLVFTTQGERPNAFSILMQGNGVVSEGITYGQGVRCVGGTIIRRLYLKSAAGGSITAPSFGAGDPTVSARSAQKGDVIQPGQSRWYLVYYRDPNVLGGCPATSTFNATQTGVVTWSP